MLSRSNLQHAATGDPRKDLLLLQEQWRANAENRAHVTLLREWDSGQQISSVPGMPNESSEHQARKPRWAAKIFSAFLDKLSFLYARDPVRSARSEVQNKLWTSTLWDFRYQGNANALMMQVDRCSRRDGTVLAVIQPGSSSSPGVFGVKKPDGVDVLLRTRDQFEVLEHKDDPRHVGAALIWWGTTTTVLDNGDRVTADDFWYFDEEVQGHVVNNEFVELEPHGRGLCPAITYRNEYPTDSPLGYSVGGQDIVNNVKSLNTYQIEMIWTGMIQRGQPWMAQKRKGEDVGLAPDNVIGVEEPGGFGIVSNGANVSGQIEVLQVMLDTLAYGMGLPTGTLNVRNTSQPQSAAVIQASDLALQQDRARRERVARVWEADTHRVAAAVLKTSGLGNPLPGISVEYTTFPAPLTHAEKMAEATFLVDKALADRAEAKRIVQPHKTDEQIAASIASAAEDAEFFTDLAAKRAGHLMDTAEAGQLGGADERDEMTTDDNVVQLVQPQQPETDTAVAAAAGVQVDRLALNGAQVTALQGVLLAVAQGALAGEAANIMIANAFPTIAQADVDTMVASAAATPPMETPQNVQ